ncbi:MAG: 4Fe-4S dicluster domain-containing protein [archaeon]
MAIESENAKEEIKEIVSKCSRCGMCKAICPVFKIIREESVGPRGKAILLDNKVYDKILYECTLCKGCEEFCAQNIELCSAIRKGRKVLVEKDQDTEAGKEMIENIRKHGNPFGKKKDNPDTLYCC